MDFSVFPNYGAILHFAGWIETAIESSCVITHSRVTFHSTNILGSQEPMTPRRCVLSTVRSILEQKGSEIVSVQPEDTLAQAILRLTQYKIGAVLVMDKKGAIKGILSERDIIRHIAGRVELSTTVSVADVMTKGVTYVKPHQSLDECLQIMTDGRFRHLPVVEDDIVVGIISIGDVVKAVLADRAFQIGQLEYYITNTF